MRAACCSELQGVHAVCCSELQGVHAAFCRLRGVIGGSVIGGSCHKYHFCRDKSMLVVTKVLSRKNYVCREKKKIGCCCFFVATNIILSRQFFFRD